MDLAGLRAESALELRVPRPLRAAAPLLVAGAVASAFASTGLLPAAVCLVVTVGCLALAGLRGLLAARDRWALRRTADGLLRTGVTAHAQSALLTWRAAELVSDGNRMLLARSLRGIVRDVERPSLPSAAPLDRSAIGPHLALVGMLAGRLAALEHPVAPRGMVLVEELLTDGGASPLYLGGRPEGLPAAIERCLAALDGDRAEEGVVVHLAERRAQAPHDARVHSGGGR
jgi:hypothetical protein